MRWVAQELTHPCGGGDPDARSPTLGPTVTGTVDPFAGWNYFNASSARFSSSTFTTGSPSTPRVRPWTCASTSART
jgi:hypothetical protein